MDAIEQVQVVTSGGQAELGRALGGYVNVVTRSGTNVLHGTTYGYFRDDALNAKNALSGTKLPMDQAQYGGSLGGPLAKDPHSDTGATIRQLKRDYEKRVKLPQSLVEELTRASVLGQQAWVKARQDNDFPSFAPHAEKLFALKRQQAARAQKCTQRFALRSPTTPFIFRLPRIEQSECGSVVDVVGLPEAHERRCVVGVKASDHLRRYIVERGRRVHVDAKLAHVHAADIVTCQRGIDIDRHRAEILADDLNAVTM